MGCSQIRAWLKTNKIFFETITATVLSIVAIIIAVKQDETANKQLEFIALQARVEEAKALPQFEVALKQIRSSETGKFDDNTLIIDNHGGAVHDFHARPFYFLDITVGIPRVGTGKVHIPLNDYLIMQAVSSGGTGLLTTMSSRGNNAVVSNFISSVRGQAQSRGWDYGLVEERLFIHITYQDLLNRYHEDFYLVSGIGGGLRVSEETAASVQKEWDGTINRKNLSMLDANDALNDAAKNIVDPYIPPR